MTWRTRDWKRVPATAPPKSKRSSSACSDYRINGKQFCVFLPSKHWFLSAYVYMHEFSGQARKSIERWSEELRTLKSRKKILELEVELLTMKASQKQVSRIKCWEVIGIFQGLLADRENELRMMIQARNQSEMELGAVQARNRLWNEQVQHCSANQPYVYVVNLSSQLTILQGSLLLNMITEGKLIQVIKYLQDKIFANILIWFAFPWQVAIAEAQTEAQVPECEE